MQRVRNLLKHAADVAGRGPRAGDGRRRGRKNTVCARGSRPLRRRGLVLDDSRKNLTACFDGQRRASPLARCRRSGRVLVGDICQHPDGGPAAVSARRRSAHPCGMGILSRQICRRVGESAHDGVHGRVQSAACASGRSWCTLFAASHTYRRWRYGRTERPQRALGGFWCALRVKCPRLGWPAACLARLFARGEPGRGLMLALCSAAATTRRHPPAALPGMVAPPTLLVFPVRVAARPSPRLRPGWRPPLR